MPVALPLPAGWGVLAHKPLHPHSFSLLPILGLKHNSFPWKESPCSAEEKNKSCPWPWRVRGVRERELVLNEYKAGQPSVCVLASVLASSFPVCVGVGN